MTKTSRDRASATTTVRVSAELQRRLTLEQATGRGRRVSINDVIEALLSERDAAVLERAQRVSAETQLSSLRSALLDALLDVSVVAVKRELARELQERDITLEPAAAEATETFVDDCAREALAVLETKYDTRGEELTVKWRCDLNIPLEVDADGFWKDDGQHLSITLEQERRFGIRPSPSARHPSVQAALINPRA